MDEKLREALEHATAAALENMCFTAVLGPAEMSAGTDVRRAEVDYAGTSHGRLTIEMTRDAVRNVAGGFLGTDAAGEAEASAVLLELASVVCGSMLSAYDPDGTFTLSQPRSVEGNAGGVPAAASTFELDAGTVRVSVSCNETGP